MTPLYCFVQIVLIFSASDNCCITSPRLLVFRRISTKAPSFRSMYPIPTPRDQPTPYFGLPYRILPTDLPGAPPLQQEAPSVGLGAASYRGGKTYPRLAHSHALLWGPVHVHLRRPRGTTEPCHIAMPCRSFNFPKEP